MLACFFTRFPCLSRAFTLQCHYQHYPVPNAAMNGRYQFRRPAGHVRRQMEFGKAIFAEIEDYRVNVLGEPPSEEFADDVSPL